MANISLPDLTARTATADTDLIHVNSGGSDYKQAKANFLRGNLSLEFSFSSLLTEQVDALPVDATYFGYLWNYGHTTETGMPINGLSYINVKKSPNAQYSIIEAWSAYSPEGEHYICGKSSGTWGSWTKVPTRSEITSLNNSLANIANNVTGTTPSSSVDLKVAYPSGLSMSNCAIVNVEIYVSGIWRNLSAMANQSNYRVITSLRSDGIYVYPTGSDAYGVQFRITLLKV